MSEQKEIAWNLIEADYRAGVKSLRQIGDEQGVTEGAIRKRAKKEGWERDLAQKVRLQAEAKVRKEVVRNEVREATRVPESVIVDANSDLLAGVTLGHRKDIGRFRSLGMALLQELESQSYSPELFEQLADLIAGPPITGSDPADKAAERRRQALLESFERTMSLPSRIDSMKKLGDTLKNLVGLEREAYGIGQEDGGAGNYEDFLDKL